MKTISGSEAKAARTERGASQAAVSAALGINRTYYSLFENGRYSLTDEQQAQLTDFFEVDAGNDDHAVPALDDNSPDDLDVPPSPDDDDADDEPRVSAASAALDDVRKIANGSGLDSKRTAAAVATAAAALDQLDYAELLSLDDERNPALAGAPDQAAFAALESLDEKEMWEKRIASSLICAELYGEAWTSCRCAALREAQRFISRRVDKGRSLSIRAGGVLWDDAEDHPHIRNELAPHIVRAAQLRLAPRITVAA